MSQAIKITVCGACTANQGPGGFAAAILYENGEKSTVAGGESKTTGNRMELAAVIEAFRHLNAIAGTETAQVTVRTASEYVCNAFNRGWLETWNGNGWKNSRGSTVKNSDLWKELQQVIGEDRSPVWELIKDDEADEDYQECFRQAEARAREAESHKGYWAAAYDAAAAETKPEPSETPASDAPSSNAVEQSLAQNRQAAESLKEAWQSCQEEDSEAALCAIQEAIEYLERQAPNLERATEALRIISMATE